MTNAQAWNYLGLACHHAGEAAEAEKAYQRALALDHDLTEAHYNLGCLWLAQNKPDAARTELMAFTLRRANSAEGLLQLGAAQLRTAEFEPTVQARSRELSAAEKSFTDALRLNPKNAEGLNGLGLARLQRGRATEAAHFFNSALTLQPDYRPALLNLAIVAQQYLKDRRLAVQKYREYLALKPPPENLDAVNALVLQLEQEMPPRGVPLATNLVSQVITNPGAQKSSATNLTRGAAPAKPEVSTNPARSTVVAALPKPAPATNLHKSAPAAAILPPAEVVSLPAEPRFKVGQDVSSTPAPNQTSPGEPSLTPSYPYKSIAKPAPGNHARAERLFSQGVQAQQGRRLPEAIQAYSSATQWDPAYFEAYYNLGLAATEAGNLQSALRAYETALAVRPESLDARYNFALVLKQANYLIDAAHELERLLVTYPNEIRAHLALGNLYARQLHQEPKARQHYSKVLEADPGNPQAGAIRYWLIDNP